MTTVLHNDPAVSGNLFMSLIVSVAQGSGDGLAGCFQESPLMKLNSNIDHTTLS